jgi:hypothetical protein
MAGVVLGSTGGGGGTEVEEDGVSVLALHLRFRTIVGTGEGSAEGLEMSKHGVLIIPRTCDFCSVLARKALANYFRI